jgi:hypothetical protein
MYKEVFGCDGNAERCSPLTLSHRFTNIDKEWYVCPRHRLLIGLNLKGRYLYKSHLNWSGT